MIFETKKLQRETLGEYLQEIRESLNFTLEEVSGKTGIKLKFLQLLEQGQYAGLPADVYVHGFLKQLAVLYAIDSEVIIDQYKKERGVQTHESKKNIFDTSAAKRYLSRFVVTPKNLSVVVGLLFAIVTLIYIVWQVLSINKTPTLEISQPQDRQIIKQTSVTVLGRTDPGMVVAINDQNVFVDSKGSFTAVVGVGNGPKELVFSAKNKFDKSVTKTITVIGQGDTASAENSASASSSPVTLVLEFGDQANLTITLDDQPEQQLVFHASDTHTFKAQNKIILSTSNAGATKATLNGQVLGLLGRPGEKLTNVIFYPDSTSNSVSPQP